MSLIAIVKVFFKCFSLNMSLIALIVKDMPTVNITAATYLCHQVGSLLILR